MYAHEGAFFSLSFSLSSYVTVAICRKIRGIQRQTLLSRLRFRQKITTTQQQQNHDTQVTSLVRACAILGIGLQTPQQLRWSPPED